MSHRHDHAPARVTADVPTLSLLRLSAWGRLAGATAALALLWLAVIATLG